MRSQTSLVYAPLASELRLSGTIGSAIRAPCDVQETRSGTCRKPRINVVAVAPALTEVALHIPTRFA